MRGRVELQTAWLRPAQSWLGLQNLRRLGACCGLPFLSQLKSYNIRYVKFTMNAAAFGAKIMILSLEYKLKSQNFCGRRKVLSGELFPTNFLLPRKNKGCENKNRKKFKANYSPTSFKKLCQDSLAKGISDSWLLGFTTNTSLEILAVIAFQEQHSSFLPVHKYWKNS